MQIISNKFLINLLIITLSGFAVSFYLQSFDVRATFHNRPWTGILVAIVPYLAAYLLVPLFSGKYNQVLNLLPLIGISLLGSFIFSIYILSHTVIKGYLDSTRVSASDYYAPTLNVFLTSSVIFFLSSAIILIVRKMIIKSREDEKNIH